MQQLESIAIRKEDKAVMLNLLSEYEQETGKRASFSKFQTVLLSTYLKHKGAGKNGNRGKDR